MEWDLSQPMTTWRTIVVSLEPFDTARQAVSSAGLETIVPPPVIVPPLTTGFHQVDISANIPEPGPGVLAVGVTCEPPHPPSRPQAVTASTELSSRSGAAFVRLKLSPLEPLAYTCSTFIVTEDSRGIRQWDGLELARTEERLRLKPDDFPIRFVPIAVSPELLELATIRGRCEWLEANHSSASSAFVLDRDRPELAIAIPAAASNASFDFDVLSVEGDRSFIWDRFSRSRCFLGCIFFPNTDRSRYLSSLPKRLRHLWSRSTFSGKPGRDGRSRYRTGSDAKSVEEELELSGFVAVLSRLPVSEARRSGRKS
ncbi:hypothetical protein [Cohnella faecalis]|uniref:hypothetical protein n=1 Tax=Cohnella faecalis TaxID=2315694 RepID=UPI0011C23880|nr:hypothetical protein [Cohnella faecalis]